MEVSKMARSGADTYRSAWNEDQKWKQREKSSTSFAALSYMTSLVAFDTDGQSLLETPTLLGFFSSLSLSNCPTSLFYHLFLQTPSALWYFLSSMKLGFSVSYWHLGIVRKGIKEFVLGYVVLPPSST
jgi:hypothetical protein